MIDMKNHNLQKLLPFVGIPALLVDFHGTLSNSRFWSNLAPRALATEANASVFSDRSPALLNDWLRGEVDSRSVNDRVAERIKVCDDWLWSRFESQSRRMRVRGREELSRLSRYFRTAVVSDNVDTFTKFTVPSKRLFDFVDVVVSSADFKAKKADADGRLFRLALGIIGCAFEDAILIDDSMDSCLAFSRIRGNAIHVSSVDLTLAVLQCIEEFCESRSGPLRAHAIAEYAVRGTGARLISNQ
jgi:FMN phosphatase YigB (HAD superfamily)